MVNSFVRKTGVDALVYPAHDASAPWLCSVKILHLDLQLTLSLEHFRCVSDEGGIPYVTLRYEGDNLVPGTMSLEDRDINVPAESLSKITRQGSPKFQTLSIILKQPCSVWYREEDLNVDMNFRRLLTLAKATKVCICFDTQWLAENATMFQDILQVSQQFARLPPTARFTQINTKAPWPFLTYILAAEPRTRVSSEEPGSGIVSSIENAGAEAPPFGDVEHDNPPPYAHVSGKRSRHTGPSLTPDAHDPKRAREHSSSSSETEHATPAPSVRAKSMASPTATEPVDIFQEAVTSAVKELLPHELARVMKKELTPVVVKKIPLTLEELLRKTPTAHSLSRCSPPAQPCNHISNAFTITERAITAAVQKALDESFHEILDESCNSASIELEDLGVVLRSNLETRAEDLMASCNDQCNEMSSDFVQHLQAKLDEGKACADNIVLAIEDRLNKALCKYQHLLTAPEKGQRAASVPVSKDDKQRIAKET